MTEPQTNTNGTTQPTTEAQTNTNETTQPEVIVNGDQQTDELTALQARVAQLEKEAENWSRLSAAINLVVQTT